MLIILVTIVYLEFIILSKRKLLDNYEMLRAGEIVISRAHQLVFQQQIVSPENLYVQYLQIIFTYVYNNSQWKRGHEFEKKHKRVYGRVWREEMEMM